MSDYCIQRKISQCNHDVSKGQTNTGNMPHICVGDIGQSGPWSSVLVVILQSTIVRQTHFCAMISVQSGFFFVNHWHFILLVCKDDESNIDKSYH